MENLTEIASWDYVPQMETTTPAMGGPGGEMNLQAQALLNRCAYLMQQLSKYIAFWENGKVYLSGDIVHSRQDGRIFSFTTFF